MRIGEGPEHADARSHLEELAKQRDQLSDQLNELKARKLEDWKQEEIEESGYMWIWDALAGKAEKLVERL